MQTRSHQRKYEDELLLEFQSRNSNEEYERLLHYTVVFETAPRIGLDQLEFVRLICIHCAILHAKLAFHQL